ncbi:MAG: hypothetical protein J2O48_10105 [Solirubrobacterales bacterium]|nr:hypothetical protein [Solirubrobacterales bacterium]
MANATKFAACMRQNGVPNFPDPSQSGGKMQIQASKGANGQTMSVDGVPVSAPAFKTANQKCAKYQPKGPPASPSQLASMRSKALKMAQCMRSSGVPNFPDPTVSTTPDGGAGIRIGGGPNKLDPNSPAFKSAMQKCSTEFNVLKGSKGGVGG